MKEVPSILAEELNKVANILDELFQFDGQIEELCSMSEMEGQFGMEATEMIETLQSFIETYAN